MFEHRIQGFIMITWGCIFCLSVLSGIEKKNHGMLGIIEMPFHILINSDCMINRSYTTEFEATLISMHDKFKSSSVWSVH